MRCLESIRLGILPTAFLFELTFPGSSARPVESGKAQEFRTGEEI